MEEMESDQIELALGRITSILSGLNSEGSSSWTELAPLVYGDLKVLANAYMRNERAAGVLQPTGLVHETYLRLIRQKTIEWKNRKHFFGVAALLMRHILVDQARRRRAEDRALTVAGEGLVGEDTGIDLETLDEALIKLAELDPRQCRVVELRYFGGLSIQETADVLQVSAKTVQRDWVVARVWLHGELVRRAG